MQRILEMIGSDLKAKKVLKYCNESIDDNDLLKESVHLIGKHLPAQALATIIIEIGNIVGVDELAEDEETFVAELIAAWQVESEVEEIVNTEDSEEEEEEESDEEYEEEEEESEDEEEYEEEEEEEYDDEEEYEEEEESDDEEEYEEDEEEEEDEDDNKKKKRK